MEQEEHDRPFVREQIVPSKKKLQAEFLKSLGRIFLYGAVFGIAAGLFFIMVENFFGKGQEIVGGQGIPESAVTNAGIFGDGTDFISDVNIESSQDSSVNGREEESKQVAVGSSYEKKIKELNQSIISIFSKSQWTGNGAANTVCFGVAVARDDVHLYFLVPYESLPPNQSELQAEFYDGSVCTATFLGKDADAGIAIVSVEEEDIPKSFEKKVEVIKAGESSQLQTGTSVLLLGCPNGSIYSADMGMVSGSPKKKYIMDYCLEMYPTNMVRDTGGAGVVVSMNGKLLGMVTDIGEGIFGKNMVAFSGISSLKRVILKIVENQPILYCGIRAEDIPQKRRVDMGITNGIYVVETKPDSPADRAGIRTGDIIQKIGDLEVTTVMDFYTEISEYKKEDIVDVHAIRISGTKKKTNKFIVRLREKE